MLKGADYTLPSAVVASGMLKVDDKKFSKSRGYVVWVKDDYLDKGLHPDLLRYYLSSYTSHNKEVNFAWKIFGDKVNTELVGALGNFFNRALTFSVKNFDASVPRGQIDPEVISRIESFVAEVSSKIQDYEFKMAADSILALAAYGNTYFQSHEPWKLVKTDMEKAGSVLRSCLQIAKALAILMEPFMPSKMQSAWKQLGQEGSVEKALFSDCTVPIPEGQKLGTPSILFNGMEDSTIKELEEVFRQRMAQAESKGKKEQEAKPQTVSYESFKAIELKVGEIKEAERIKGSNKLLKLIVDIGTEKRQVVAGIAEAYRPEELVGTQVVMVANLEKAKLFGVESQGMLLAADIKGKAVLLRPQERVEPGTKVR